MDKEGLTARAAAACLAAALFLPVAFAADPVENRIREFYGLPEGQRVSVTVIEKDDDIPPALSALPGYVAGVAFPATGEIAIFRERTGAYPFGSFEQVYAHELSHVYLYRATGIHAPRWFDEGVAMRLAAEWGYKDDLYLSLALPRIAHGGFDLDRLERDFRGTEGAGRISYAVSRAFVKDLFHSNEDLRGFIGSIGGKGSFEIAFAERFGKPPENMFRPWAKRLPWWGPVVSLLASAGSFWTLALALFLIAALVSYRRRRAWKKKWEEEEAGRGDLLQ